MHQPPPLTIAEESDDGVEGIKDAVERNPLIPIQAGADGIDKNPGNPLLQVFSRQHPHSDDTQGRREGIRDWDCAVGEEI